MKAKNLFKLLAPFLVLILYGCPGEELSFNTKSGIVPDLAKIEPLQNIYTVGDEIIYSMVVPSHFDQFGYSEGPIDIFEETGVHETLFGGEIHRFTDNEITVLEGKNVTLSNTLVAYLKYYPNENEYRYKVKIKFTQPGVYTILGLNSILFGFTNTGDGFNYNITTNVIGITDNNNNGYTITVQ